MIPRNKKQHVFCVPNKTQTTPGDLVLPMLSRAMKFLVFAMIRWRIETDPFFKTLGDEYVNVMVSKFFTSVGVKISLVSQSVGRENQNISKEVPSALAMCGAFFVQVVTNSFKYSSSWNPQGNFHGISSGNFQT